MNPTTSLPLMFLTITLLAALMFFGGFMLPESPRWLMLKGRREQAVAVLSRTMNTQQEIDFEIEEIQQALHGPQCAGVGIVLRGYFFKVLVVGVLLQVFQQLVGINMMIYYSPTIFGYAGMKGLLAAMTVPTVNMLFTFPAIHLVEKWGCKKLLYFGAVVRPQPVCSLECHRQWTHSLLQLLPIQSSACTTEGAREIPYVPLASSDAAR